MGMQPAERNGLANRGDKAHMGQVDTRTDDLVRAPVKAGASPVNFAPETKCEFDGLAPILSDGVRVSISMLRKGLP